jgi:chromosomal replication initiation ATPase DnaA
MLIPIKRKGIIMKKIAISSSMLHYMERMADFIRMEIEAGHIRYGSPIDQIYRAYTRELDIAPPTQLTLKAVFPQPEDSISLDEIMDAVCNYFDLKKKTLVSDSRNHSVVEARKIYVFLCRKLTTKTLEAIGKIINRNHSTLLYLLDIVESRVKYDTNFLYNIKIIEDNIKEK